MVWPGKGPFKKPAQQATGCHANQTNITSLASGPGHHVVSHAGWIFREGRARGPGLLRSASRQTQEGCTHTSVFSYFGALRVSIFDKPLSKETLFFNPFFFNLFMSSFAIWSKSALRFGLALWRRRHSKGLGSAEVRQPHLHVVGAGDHLRALRRVVFPGPAVHRDRCGRRRVAMLEMFGAAFSFGRSPGITLFCCITFHDSTKDYLKHILCPFEKQ